MSKRAKTYLAIVITTIVFIFLMRVWPYELVKNPSTNAHASIKATEESKYLEAGKPVTQVFVTAGNFLQKIEIECNIDKRVKSEQIYALVLDENHEVIYEERIPVKKISNDGTLTLKPKTECTYGRLYTIELYLSGTDSLISVKLADIAMLGQTEYSEIAQFEVAYDYSKGMMASYTYMADCTPMRIVFYYVVTIAGGIMLWFVIGQIYGRFFAENEKARRIFVYIIKSVVSVVLLVLYGYGFYKAAICNVFGGQIYDQVIHGLGMTLLLLFILFLLWKNVIWKEQEKKGELEKLDDPFYETGAVSAKKGIDYSPLNTWITYLQVIAIGLLLHCCVLYQDAAKMQEQKTNLAWAGILLGIVVLLQQFHKTIGVVAIWRTEAKSLKRGSRLVDPKKHKRLTIFLGMQLFLVVALLVYLVYDSQGYCQKMGVDAEALELARLTCVRTGIWAVIILHTILYFRPAILKKLSIPLVVIWIFFAIWLWTHQYKYLFLRDIPVYFSLMMVQDFDEKDFKQLMRNMMNGMIVAFFINMSLSLLYRPYQRWLFYRYPMYFHTVACTGEFLVAAETAVLAKFLLKVKGGSVKKGFLELVLLGIIFVYSLFSMARTTMTSTAILVCGGLGLTAYIYKKNWKQILQIVVALFLSMLVAFPTIFSATRIIPALVDDPYRFPIDMEQNYEYGVEKGDPIDSRDYMVFMRFLYCYMSRYHFPEFIEEWVAEQYQPIAKAPIDVEHPILLADNAYAAIPRQFVVFAGISEGSPDDAANQDLSNGRFDIWKTYLQDLNMTGHDKIAILNSEGEEYCHAHNSFIQMAHSTGIIGGIAFLILYLVSVLYTILNTAAARKEENKSKDIYLILFMIVIGFGVASLTEWLATMMIPLSMLYWMSIVILTRKSETKNERKKLRTV